MDRFQELYNQIVKILEQTHTQLSVSNVFETTIEMMQMVEQFQELSGAEKKDLVLGVLTYIIKNQIDNDQIETAVLQVVQFSVPTLIDTIIAFDKGELHINIQKELKKCKGRFLACCSK